ncbi:MAG: isoamylase early set domain-containing protein [bacterium]
MSKTMTKTKKRVTFEVKAEPGSEVYLAGDFNNWEPNKKLTDKNNDGTFRGTLLLDRQKNYEYKFVINGKWSVDPNCEEWTPNNLGSLNSVIKT